MTRVCEKCGGTEFRGKRQQCVACAKVRNNARYARLSADPEWVRERLARKRAWGHARGVTPREEVCAATARRRAFKVILASWQEAEKQERLRAIGSNAWWRRVAAKFAKRFGGTVEAAKYRLRYHHDPDFRAKQVERLHKRNAMRDHRIEMQADGTLTVEATRSLYAAAKCCHYCERPISGKRKTLDHVVPISRGGMHSIHNAVIACHPCNTSKAGMTPEEWRSGQRIKRGDGQGLRPKQVVSDDALARRRARAIAKQEENNARMRTPEWRERCKVWREQAVDRQRAKAA